MNQDLTARTAHRLAIFVVTLLLSSQTFSQSISDIRDDLLRMLDSDQQGRREIRQIEQQYGYDSPEWRAAWDEQNAVDAANVQQFEEIIKQIGWPKVSEVGGAAAVGAFLIVQHADLESQREYLPLLKEAVDADEADGRSYALLYDRVVMGEGKKQLYGTQLRRNEETGGFYLWPIEDEAQIDTRRAELGMGPLEEEISNYLFDIEPVPRDVAESFND